MAMCADICFNIFKISFFIFGSFTGAVNSSTLSDDEVEENSQISEHEIADDTDAVAETADEQTEDSESVVTVDSSGEASEDEETDFENVA